MVLLSTLNKLWRLLAAFGIRHRGLFVPKNWEDTIVIVEQLGRFFEVCEQDDIGELEK